jgi:FkbM family methyltransferase
MIFLETYYIRLISLFTRSFSFKGIYRIALFLYPFKSSFFKGIITQQGYLKKQYQLRINLSSNNLIDHKILFTGCYEEDTNKILEKHVLLGHTVIEAGANTGTETLLLSRLVGPKGKILAFEPVPHVVDKLVANLSINNIDNVSIYSCALGDSQNEISFSILPETHPNQGMGSKLRSKQIDPSLKRITVKQTTIDDLYRAGELPQFNFLKMDVQGAEMDILNGGVEAIAKFKPKIFLEAAEGWNEINLLYLRLSDLGYQVFYIKSDHGLLLLSEGQLLSGNWLAIYPYPSTSFQESS